MNPNDFISEDRKSWVPSEWIMNRSGARSTDWLHMDKFERVESMIAAIIAWIDVANEQGDI